MSESNQSYKELAIPYFKEVFDIIDEVLTAHDIPYYLIGVNAISLELLKKGTKPARGTKDIDFAIMVSALDEYEEISDSIQDQGFTKAEAAWRFHHKEFDIVVDLLPFGEIEESETIGFSDRTTDLHVLGFKEVMDDATEVNIGETKVRIPPLPGMVILKLVAWSDRPEVRNNDLYDILRVIEHYNDLEYENNLKYHYDIIEEMEEFDEHRFSSRILGRKVKPYLDKSPVLKQRIESVLEKNTADASTSEIARNWAREKGWNLEYCITLLNDFKAGIGDRNS
ncbi:MAG: nucleotidyl transferase AbiEii/AbiGii toxin family protein [Balneolaceae bacterium]|nr:nucleotidyl transferase AbiEii/AbiGii toxin family protein [Balneolaceae bacterium]